MKQTTIRLHSFIGTNDGTVSCDFRGDKFIGDAEGDHHKTLFELDVDESDPIVAEILAIGPQINSLFSRLEHSAESDLHISHPGEVPGLRMGVWDKNAPH